MVHCDFLLLLVATKRPSETQPNFPRNLYCRYYQFVWTILNFPVNYRNESSLAWLTNLWRLWHMQHELWIRHSFSPKSVQFSETCLEPSRTSTMELFLRKYKYAYEFAFTNVLAWHIHICFMRSFFLQNFRHAVLSFKFQVWTKFGLSYVKTSPCRNRLLLNQHHIVLRISTFEIPEPRF